MRRYLAFALLALLASSAWAADTKVSADTNLATLTGDDEFYCVDDPAGTPLSRACTATVLQTFVLTGEAATCTALAANGANCAAGEIPLGVDASGAAEGCYEPTEADITDLDHLTEAEARTGLIENGSAEMTIETLGTACTDGQAVEANATGGVDCVTTGGDVTGALDALTIGNDKILEAHLKAVDAAVDEECLTYESTTGDFEWQTCGGGADTNAVREFVFPAAALDPSADPGDSFPAPAEDEGTNIDVSVLNYDDTTDECAGGAFVVPSDADTGGTATFRLPWYSGGQTTGTVNWYVKHTSGQAEGVTWDSSMTTEAAAADTTQGTVDQITVTTWTETMSNLAWAASDVVHFLVCRDANHGSEDTMTGDASLLTFSIEVPRS